MIKKEEWQEIKNLQREGLRAQTISSQLGISTSSIYKYMKIENYERYRQSAKRKR